MANPVSAFKKLPLKTKQLLGLGVVFALFIALPLFVWAISTQRFELREKASVTCGDNICHVGEDENSCPQDCMPNQIKVPPCGDGYCDDDENFTSCPTDCSSEDECQKNEDCQQNSECIKEICNPSVGPCNPNTCACSTGFYDCDKDASNGCESNSECSELEKTSCSGDNDCQCGLDIYTGQCAIGNYRFISGQCNAPDFCSGISGNLFPGCVNGQCTLKSQPNTCPRGPQGNLNCDPSGIINEIDLARLLLLWRPSMCVGEIQPPDPVFRHPDLNGDCYINEVDLAILLLNWRTN